MNRRSFISSILAASVPPLVLPGAGRLWKRTASGIYTINTAQYETSVAFAVDPVFGDSCKLICRYKLEKPESEGKYYSMKPLYKHKHEGVWFSRNGHLAYLNGEKPKFLWPEGAVLEPTVEHHIEIRENFRCKRKLVMFYWCRNKQDLK